MSLIFKTFVVGYRYGKTIVPLTKIDKDSMKLPTEKCLKVLQFTSSQNVSRNKLTFENEHLSRGKLWLDESYLSIFIPRTCDGYEVTVRRVNVKCHN